MRDKETGTKRSSGDLIPSVAIPVLMGTAVTLLTLLMLSFLIAALVWGEAIPLSRYRPLLVACAGLCGFAGGRTAIRFAKGDAVLAGIAATVLPCVLLVSLRGAAEGLHSSDAGFWSVPLMLLAGGCLAGLLGKGRRKRKRKNSARSK